LVHNQIIEAFQEKKFTGWESYPIKIFGKIGNIIEDYYAFIIKWVCDHYDVSKSKIIDYTRDYRAYIVTEKRYQGMYFDP